MTVLRSRRRISEEAAMSLLSPSHPYDTRWKAWFNQKHPGAVPQDADSVDPLSMEGDFDDAAHVMKALDFEDTAAETVSITPNARGSASRAVPAALLLLAVVILGSFNAPLRRESCVAEE